MENPIECEPREDRRESALRIWLKRIFIVIGWFAVYLILPTPLDLWFGCSTVAAFVIWLYSRVSGRLKLPPLTVRFERVQTITLNHILLALLLLFAFANYSELVKLNRNTQDVQNDIVDLQNAASDNKDEIKSSLDDVKSAVEATQ